MRRQHPNSSLEPLAGLTLLEVLLALAILASTLIAVSPIVDAGLRAAIAAELEAEAAVIAASRLDAIAAGLTSGASTGPVQCVENPDLKLEVVAAARHSDELTSLTVSVSNTPVEGQSQVRVSLTRLVPTNRLMDRGIGSKREDAGR